MKTKEVIKTIKDYQDQGIMETCDFFKNESFKIEDADDKKHTILFVASDETVDRVNERLIAKGCNTGNYNKTGKPFLWCHNRREDNPPIGRGVWAKIIDNELKILTEFYVDKGNAWSDFSKTIYEMYRDDFMQAVSVGYIPNDRRDPTKEELKLAPELRLITEEWELLEHSAVPVPANPNAVQQKILSEKMQEVKEAMNDNRILIPSICVKDFGFEEEKKEEPKEEPKEKEIPMEGAEGESHEKEAKIEAEEEKDYDLIAVYDITTGEEIGVAKIPKKEVVETKEKPAIRIIQKKTGVIVKDSKKNPENSEKSEGLSLTEEQIKTLQDNICSEVKGAIVDSFLGEFRRKLGIVDETKL